MYAITLYYIALSQNPKVKHLYKLVNQPRTQVRSLAILKSIRAFVTHPTDYSHLLEALSKKLHSQLEAFHSLPIESEEDEQLKSRNIKKALSSFIKTAVQSRISMDSIKKVLAGMYSNDLLVDSTCYEWALEQIAFTEKNLASVEGTNEHEAVESLPNLFNEDTVYHACLCSLATSTCTAANYKDFFNNKFPNHSLEAASISRSQDKEDVDRYLIARQEKVFYVAFKSEPLLSDWMKKFSSFEKGIQI